MRVQSVSDLNWESQSKSSAVERKGCGCWARLCSRSTCRPPTRTEQTAPLTHVENLRNIQPTYIHIRSSFCRRCCCFSQHLHMLLFTALCALGYILKICFHRFLFWVFWVPKGLTKRETQLGNKNADISLDLHAFFLHALCLLVFNSVWFNCKIINSCFENVDLYFSTILLKSL